MKNIFKCALLLIIAGACTNDEFMIEGVDSPTKPVGVQSVNRSMDEVLQIANNAARLLENAQTRSVGRTINPVATQYVVAPATRTGENDTLLYIVNYANEQGFAVISANRNAEGLLAVTEQGSYGVDGEYYTDNPGFTAFMERAKAYASVTIGGDGFLPLLQQKLVSDTVYEYKIGPYINVRWGQSGIEGKFCPNHIAGCSPVAMAQIMSHFKYPSDLAITYDSASVSFTHLDWESMVKHEVDHRYRVCGATESAHDMIGLLIRQLGELSFSKYKDNATSTYFDDVRYALKTLNYQVSYITDYSPKQDLIDLLESGKLLLMRGISLAEEGSVGHSLAVDGAWIFTERLSQWVKEKNQLEWRFNCVLGETTKEYLHFNWGGNGNCNGFFKLGVFSPDNGTYDNHGDLYDNNVGRDYKYGISYFTVSR